MLSYHTSPSPSNPVRERSHPLVELAKLNLQSRHYETVSEINATIGQRSRWSNAMNRFEQQNTSRSAEVGGIAVYLVVVGGKGDNSDLQALALVSRREDGSDSSSWVGTQEIDVVDTVQECGVEVPGQISPRLGKSHRPDSRTQPQQPP